MAYNLSYFVETLPEAWDSWQTDARDSYYSRYLWGYWHLDSYAKDQLAATFDTTGLVTLLHDITAYVVETPNSDNVTWTAIQYLMGSMTTIVPSTTIYNPCDDIEEDHIDFMIYCIPAVIVLILLLSILIRRKALCHSFLWGRPGLIYPVNFLEEMNRRWAYAAIFAMMSYQVLLLFEGVRFWKPKKFDDPDFSSKFGWLSVVVNIINVIILGLVYYPLLACVSLRHFIVCNVLGLLYLSAWAYSHINIWVKCPLNHEEEAVKTSAMFYAIFEIPMLACLLALTFSYSFDLFLNIRCLCRQERSFNILEKVQKTKGESHCHSLSEIYVREMLKRRKQDIPVTFLGKIKKLMVYTVVKGYRYSPRMICTLVATLLIIYKTATYFGALSFMLRDLGEELLETFKDDLLSDNTTDTYILVKDGIHVAFVSFMVANVLSVTLHLIFMVHILIVYRRNLSRLIRGDREWHFKYEDSPSSVLVSSMRYPGYQIAYMIYGYIIMLLVVWIVGGLFAYLIIIPLRDGHSSIVLDQLKNLWPSVLIGVLIYIVQVIAARFLFLQERGAYVALNNRRLYHTVNFFMIFFNVLLGLFSCLKRILLSVVFGVVLISRLDYCLLMRGFEKFDAGFKSYLGMLQVDVYHNHPVLRVYVEIMTRYLEQQRWQNMCIVVYSDLGNPEKNKDEKNKIDRRRRLRNKWWKIVTLANNPQLVVEWLHVTLKKRMQDVNKDNNVDVVDQLGNVSAFVVGASIIATGNEISNATGGLKNFAEI